MRDEERDFRLAVLPRRPWRRTRGARSGVSEGGVWGWVTLWRWMNRLEETFGTKLRRVELLGLLRKMELCRMCLEMQEDE